MILVDGYNVIHAVGRLKELLRGRSQAEACRALVDLCTRWREARPDGQEVVIVLDGARPGDASVHPAPGLSVRYMLDGADADLTQLLKRKGRHTLVSADGELVNAAQNLAQDVEAPKVFFSRVLEELKDAHEHDEKQRTPSPAEVQDWLEHFGEAPDEKPAPQASGGLSPDEVNDWLAYFDGDESSQGRLP